MAAVFTSDFSGYADGTQLQNIPGWVATGSSLGYANAQVFAGELDFYKGAVSAAVNYGYNVGDAVHGVKFKDLSASTTINVYVRYQDAQNHIKISLGTGSGGTARIDKIVAGVTTNLHNGFTPRAVGDVWEITQVGTKLFLYINGARVNAAVGGDIANSPAGTVVSFDAAPYKIDDLIISDSAVASISVTLNPVPRVIQRAQGGGSRSLSIGGTYVGATGIEVRLSRGGSVVAGKDWQAVPGLTISGGVWSGNISGLTEGLSAYSIDVRASNDTSAVAATQQVFVGILLATYGQSNSTGWSNSSVPNPQPVSPTVWTIDGMDSGAAWSNAAGNGAHYAASKLAAAANLPVGVIRGGLGGAAATSLTPGNAPWTSFSAALTKAGGDIAALLWNQGESGPFNSTWTTAVETIRSAVAAIAGRPSAQIPFLIAGLGRAVGASGATTDNNYVVMRNLQVAAASTAGGYLALTEFDLAMSDALHFSSQGYQDMADRWAASLLVVFGLGSVDGAGPTISSVSRSGLTVTVGINLRGATSITKSSASAATGWSVSADNWATTLAITDAQISGSSVILTLASAPSGPVSVRHLWGADPVVTNAVKGAGYTIGNIIVQGGELAESAAASADASSVVINLGGGIGVTLSGKIVVVL